MATHEHTTRTHTTLTLDRKLYALTVIDHLD
jgi:hypothetical protein